MTSGIYVLLGRDNKILITEIWSLFFLHGAREDAQSLGDQPLSLREATL